MTNDNEEKDFFLSEEYAQQKRNAFIQAEIYGMGLVTWFNQIQSFLDTEKDLHNSTKMSKALEKIREARSLFNEIKNNTL